MRCLRVGLLLALSALSLPQQVAGQQEAAAAVPADLQARPLQVGVSASAPFAYREGGEWTGIDVELWEAIARELGLRYVLVPMSLDSLLGAAAAGEIDVALGALTLTPEREAVLDFTHSYFTTGLAIATMVEERSGWIGFVKRIFSWEILYVLGLVIGLLLLFGTAFWLLERRAQPERFGRNLGEAIEAGFYWAAVTNTTTGYGDVYPVTRGGRRLAMIWMYASFFIISVFTGTIAAIATVGELSSRIRGVDDLRGAAVASVPASTSAEYLDEERIRFVSRSSVEEALDALHAGTVEAVVYDAPILQYLIRSEGSGALRVLPGTFEQQLYAFALPEDTRLREAINRALLQILERPEWDRVRFRYLGE